MNPFRQAHLTMRMSLALAIACLAGLGVLWAGAASPARAANLPLQATATATGQPALTAGTPPAETLEPTRVGTSTATPFPSYMTNRDQTNGMIFGSVVLVVIIIGGALMVVGRKSPD